MEAARGTVDSMTQASRRIALRMLALAHNRLELLALEVQEERDHLLHTLLLALGVGLFAVLAGFTLTALLVLVLWNYAPWALLALGILQACVALLLARRLTRCLHAWRSFAASLENLRKDRRALERLFS